MNAERRLKVNGYLIEEYYWSGKFVVYVDHRLVSMDFDEAVEIYKVKKRVAK